MLTVTKILKDNKLVINRPNQPDGRNRGGRNGRGRSYRGGRAGDNVNRNSTREPSTISEVWLFPHCSPPYHNLTYIICLFPL